MKKIFFSILCSAAIYPVLAQNIVDAGRFGTTDISGTARYRSMAGAFGALGGDATCMSDNPAGIGVYRGTSLFTFSPTLQITKTQTDVSEKVKCKKSDMSVSNLAYIISIRPEGTEHLVNFNIGLGFNHSEGVNRRYKVVNDKPKSSFGTYLSTRANNALRATNNWNNPNYLASDAAWDNADVPLIALMGYDSYAIDDATDNFGEKAGVVAFNDANHLEAFQRLAVLEKNRFDEYNINVSGNWEDVIYAGLTLSIVDYNSTINSDLYEDYDFDYNGSYTEYYNDLETQGSGVNFKLGVIYRPTDAWRIGVAVHTPTWFDMKDYYNGAMLTDDERCKDFSYANNDGAYEYRYKYFSPWQYQFSTAYVIGNRAIVSLEYDLKDFSSAKYKSAHDYSSEYSGMNRLVRNNMEKQHTFKAGVEYRINKNLSIRGGYAAQTSPYSNDVLDNNLHDTGWSEHYQGSNYWGDDYTLMFDSSTKTNYSLLNDTKYICGGIGWSRNHWFFDFAVMDRIINDKVAAYPTTQSVTFDQNWKATFSEGVHADIVDLKTHAFKYDLTIGYRF